MARNRDVVLNVIAVATLALGIGASTAIFSVVRAVLLAPIPHSDGQRVVALNTVWTNTGRITPRVSGPDWSDVSELADAFESTARYHGGEIGIQWPGGSDFAGVYLVSPGFFQVFDASPIRGRKPAEADALRAVLVSAPFAERIFGSVDQALSKTLTIDTSILQVVGVMPASFRYPDRADIWWVQPEKPENHSRSAYNYRAVAKLRIGVSLESAQARITALAGGLEQSESVTNKNKTFRLVPLTEQIAGNARGTILLLFAATGLLLLIACANVAHLLLARAVEQAREFGIRSALGASASRLFGEALRNGLTLGISAGALGILLAFALVRGLIWLNPPDLPRLSEVRVDGVVLAASVAVSLMCTVLFALAPALQNARADRSVVVGLETHRRRGRPPHLGPGSWGLRNLIVVGEVAISFALAIGAGLLFRSFVELNSVSLGFETERILVTYAHVPANTMPKLQRAIRSFDDAVSALRVLPGVVSASAAMGVPAGRYGSNGLYFIEGQGADPRLAPSAGFSLTGEDYFATLGIPLVRGRDFNPRDTYDSPFVAIVSESLVRRSFGDTDPIGKRIQCGLDSPNKWMTVVGVVGDARTKSPATAPGPELYMPYRQHPWYANELQLVVRTAGSPAGFADTVERRVRSLIPEVALKTTTLSDMHSATLATPRLRTILLGAFAAIALLLSITGVYSLLSWQVARRVPEFGLRMAIGASTGEIVWLVLRWAGTLTIAGLLAGAALSFFASSLLKTMLFGLEPTDGLTWTFAALALLVLGLCSAALPALRASRVDPATTLRQE
ncbi:MAG: ABC transporter permease [Bryobacteraceae bacterium]|nr:ABC transporter permease [Bryobacteraceae bacterium]